MGSGSMVVSMMTITNIEKISSETTPIALPVTAKIRPTSPRGTIPQPTIDLLTLPATKPDMTLLTTADIVIAKVNIKTGKLNTISSLTLMSVKTKKIGTKK